MAIDAIFWGFVRCCGYLLEVGMQYSIPSPLLLAYVDGSG